MQRELIEKKDTTPRAYSLTLSELDEPYFLQTIKSDPPTDAHEDDLEAGQQINRIERLALRHIAEHGGAARGGVQRQASAEWRQDAENRLKQRGFPGTIGTQQTGEAAARELEMHIRQDHLAAVTDREMFEGEERFFSHKRSFQSINS